ncbi:MFS transporter [Helicobacter suis]|uniref:MFS transporter n=1 Tax=Helicobacter suis TaxID=104628 RepID=UPI0013D334EC|nr:MFS transporter [Helicobacter suis]
MRHYMRIIALLACSSFCLGVAEFIVSGILTRLSVYYGVSNSEAGNLATFYACGVVVGAPIVSVLISSWNYRNQLVFTLSVFCLSNAAVFLSNTLWVALFARFISGLMHGLFFVIATIISIKVAPKSKTSMALSLMASGLTIALVTGVPIGILLSKNYGLLSPFLLIASLSFLVALLAFFVMPKLSSKQANFKNLGIAFKYIHICQGFVVTALSCGSMFVVYIYLRILLEQHDFSPDEIANVYLGFGIAAIFGNLFGGRLTDSKGSFSALRFLLTVQMFCLSAMSFTHSFSKSILVTNIMAFGFFGCALIAPLKMLSSYLARTFTPDTKNDTIALNESSFNVGITFASLVGGLVARYLYAELNGIFAGLFALGALITLLYGIKKVYFRQK